MCFRRFDLHPLRQPGEDARCSGGCDIPAVTLTGDGDVAQPDRNLKPPYGLSRASHTVCRPHSGILGDMSDDVVAVAVEQRRSTSRADGMPKAACAPFLALAGKDERCAPLTAG